MTNTPETANLLKLLRPIRKPQVLYHYTSGAGLIGILNSRCLWATNIRFLNDSREYALALDLTLKSIESRLQNANSRYDEGLYRVLKGNIDDKTTAEVYVTSFSANADQLSQWRAYCPGTGGYAIGFSGKSLIKTLNSHADRFLAQCIYEPLAQEKVIEDLICAVEVFAESARRDGLAQDRVYRESYKLIGRLLALLAPILKDRSFAEEQEWRLLCLGTSFDETPPQFRMGQSTLVPYFEHTITSQNGDSPICEVVIGPTPHPGLAQEAAQTLLSSRGLQSAKLRTSSIPYRAW
jgi:hypothetical protein